MIRVPIDPLGLRRKLIVQWMKGIWVGKLDESDGHVVLHSTWYGHWTNGAKIGWTPPNSRQIWLESSRVRVQDPAPIRLAAERDTETLAVEQNRAAQREHMEGIVNERARAEITRSSQAPEDDNDRQVKRQRLGEPLATIPEGNGPVGWFPPHPDL